MGRLPRSLVDQHAQQSLWARAADRHRDLPRRREPVPRAGHGPRASDAASSLHTSGRQRRSPRTHAKAAPSKGELLRTDHPLGAFWNQLKQGGHTDDLVFAFTSDHGEAFNDHPMESARHSCPCHNNQSVPLLVRYPKTLPLARIDTTVRTLDLYATLPALAGIPIDHSINAESSAACRPGHRSH